MRLLTRLASILCSACIVLGPAQAQDSPKPAVKAAKPVPTKESDTEELRKYVIESGPTNDWIMINSGEWLKGRIKSMLDDKLEFDSEELDLQSFDLKDVYFLYSPKLNGVRTEDKTTDFGTLWMDRTNLVVTSTVTNEYPRKLVLGIAPGGERERNYWSGKLAIGLAIRQGNVNQVDFNTSASLRRITPSTKLSLDYIGNYSELESVENANNHRVSISFDLFLSKRLFIRIPFAEYYRDPFQNISTRLTLGAGLGYDIVKSPNFDWNITAGPAYQTIQYVSVPSTEKLNQNTPAVVIGTSFDWDITSKLEFLFDYQNQLTPKKAGGMTQHMVATLEYEVTKILDLQTSFTVDTVSNPQPDSSGNIPEKADMRLVFGIVVNF